MTDSAQPGTRGRLPAWMGILCILMGIAVAGVVIGGPCWRQYRALSYVFDSGGNVETEPGGPDWLRRLVGDKPMLVFDRVSEVHLAGTDVTDAGLVQLRSLTNLERLDLSRTDISDAGLVHLSGFSKLWVLNLNGTGVTDAGLVHLSGLTNVSWLILTRTDVTDAGLVHLTGLTKLRNLFLGETRVSDTGVKMFRKARPVCWIPWGPIGHKPGTAAPSPR